MENGIKNRTDEVGITRRGIMEELSGMKRISDLLGHYKVKIEEESYASWSKEGEGT